jgi:PqqD family protein of HPr-rel-A system
MTSTLENIMLNDKGIAFNPVTGETFRLVGSAVPLVRLLKQGADSAALLDYLLKEYKVDQATAQRDLDAFLATLERMNWVEVAS